MTGWDLKWAENKIKDLILPNNLRKCHRLLFTRAVYRAIILSQNKPLYTTVLGYSPGIYSENNNILDGSTISIFRKLCVNINQRKRIENIYENVKMFLGWTIKEVVPILSLGHLN